MSTIGKKWPALPFRPDVLLLDFDGVILESAEIKTQAFAEIYSDEDPEKVLQVVTYQRVHGGVSRREKFRYFEKAIFGRAVEAERIEALAKRFSEVALEKVLAAPFVPGAVEFLNAAKGKAAVYVVSGTPEDELKHVVFKRGLANLFDAVIGAPTTKLEAFKSAILERHTKPARALAVGDSKTELAAAEQLGIPFIGIRDSDGRNPFPAGITSLADLRSLSSRIGY